MNKKVSSESVVKNIRRSTRKKYSLEEKIRIFINGLRGEDSIAYLCRREGIPNNLYNPWIKDFLETGKKRLMGDTALLRRWSRGPGPKKSQGPNLLE